MAEPTSSASTVSRATGTAAARAAVLASRGQGAGCGSGLATAGGAKSAPGVCLTTATSRTRC
eukprot:213412-Lingulodinium_polyedra.AAC.1